jgi:hypothetical protein
MSVVIREGLAICRREPQCAYGLEGFNEGSAYRFQLMERDEPGRKGQRYLRLWHPAVHEAGHYPESYDCCRPEALSKFFREEPA